MCCGIWILIMNTKRNVINHNPKLSQAQQQFIVNIYTNRWSNIGLTISFFFTAFFTFAFLNSDISTWWYNLTEYKIVTIILNIILFIPVAFLLIMCIVAHSHYNNIKDRIMLMIGFSFLISIFLVFIFCSSLNDISSFASSYSIGIFLTYCLMVLFSLSAIDIFLMPYINISHPLELVPSLKTIFSLPLVFIIWYVTDNAWIWLIPILVFILYLFYNATSQRTWVKINKKYESDYKYKVSFFTTISMFKGYNYRKLGLFLSLYNFLPNIFNILSDSINNLDIATEGIGESVEKEDVLSLAFSDTYKTSRNELSDTMKLPKNLMNPKFTYVKLFCALIMYIASCIILYYIGNLFV